MQAMLGEVAGLSVVQDIIQWCYYRGMADMIVEGSEGSGRRGVGIVGCVEDNSDESPECAGKNKCEKAERSLSTSVFAFGIQKEVFSPI
jgi:hypothetical protein